MESEAHLVKTTQHTLFSISPKYHIMQGPGVALNFTENLHELNKMNPSPTNLSTD